MNFISWLRGLATKSSQGYGFLSTGKATPTWATFEYKDYVREGYQSLVWVYRCVREIAEAISSVPWVVKERDSNGNERVIEGHPLTQLLKQPNPIMTGGDLFEAWSIFLSLSGNSFFELVKSGNTLLEIYPLRPDYMKIVPDAVDFVSKYIFEVEGKKIPYDPSEIIHWKYLDPLNAHRGMSPFLAGATIIDTENEAIRWNKVLLENSATPSGSLVVPPDVMLTPSQRLALKDQIETKFSRENAHRPMLLEAGMDWKQMGISQRDMEFAVQRQMNAREICGLFGVPPWMVGVTEPKYDNYGIARLAFWEETIITLLEKIKAGLNQRVAPLFGKNRIFVDYDLSNVPAMREAFAQKIETAERLTTMGWPLNAVNAKLNLGFDPVPWGEEPLVNATLVPISAILDGSLDNPTDGDKPNQDQPSDANKPKWSGRVVERKQERQNAIAGG